MCSRGQLAGPVDLVRDAQELLALVATFEQPPQRLRRVLQAMLRVDLGLELSFLHPAGERTDRLRSARHVIEYEKPSIRPRWTIKLR
jgi:hypothetical protein